MKSYKGIIAYIRACGNCFANIAMHVLMKILISCWKMRKNCVYSIRDSLPVG